MFDWNQAKRAKAVFSLEGLEDRRLMSHGHCGADFGNFGSVGGGQGLAGGSHVVVGLTSTTIQFSQAPTAVRDGLTALAVAANLTAPTGTQTVYLGNSEGVETYTMRISSAHKLQMLIVDQHGQPVAAPARSTTTFGELTNTAVTDEITAIADALQLTTLTAATTVKVLTASDGTATYSVSLRKASTSKRVPRGVVTITVDSNGTPVGNQRLPLNTLPAAIQDGLTGNAPAGATALTGDSLIDLRLQDGVTLYSATYTSIGVRTTVTVNSAGELTDLPKATDVEFVTLPEAAKAELAALAAAAGWTDPISDTQSVRAYEEANGTTIYTLRLSRTVTFSVDQDGNPTVPPGGHLTFMPPKHHHHW